MARSTILGMKFHAQNHVPGEKFPSRFGAHSLDDILLLVPRGLLNALIGVMNTTARGVVHTAIKAAAPRPSGVGQSRGAAASDARTR